MSKIEPTPEGREGDAASGPATDGALGGGADLPPIVATPKYHPSYVFLAVVSAISLAADLFTKLWAERRLDVPDAHFHPVELIKDHLDFVLAKNRGGAWGLLQDTPEHARRPFFLLVSALAITFI